ncbi:hypothetical protein QQF64_024102 [Cirrhinus molitorella]|uniref:AIG1-type G domain-containing protein n=1 Tax=Cirrhinus molitorella TaxID=172907 RepID=A0ABR3NKK3_9TELE
MSGHVNTPQGPQNHLRPQRVKQSLVLFTHGEQLEGQTIEEFVKKSEELKEYVDKCGGRCHVIDSKYWKNSWWGYKSNRFQVKNLLDTIDKMRKENGCYTNELLQILGEEIEKEFHLTDPNFSQEERREKAKKNVLQKLLIKFAGVATGTLVGAIMGIAVPVASLVAIVKGVKKNLNK